MTKNKAKKKKQKKQNGSARELITSKDFYVRLVEEFSWVEDLKAMAQGETLPYWEDDPKGARAVAVREAGQGIDELIDYTLAVAHEIALEDYAEILGDEFIDKRLDDLKEIHARGQDLRDLVFSMRQGVIESLLTFGIDKEVCQAALKAAEESEEVGDDS